ncbi:GIY-YIG nuclease family protein [Sulfurimonas sp.]|uniref:GIY-YIG nuclease family protein n=1 Tax=Sulfurimonas sp. TaxID=2022749 RepID=UPI00260391AB|nr:GIY-YIG nuclease family protein [Sulfurimonas sp.]
MSNYFVYILECSDETLYTGITTDIQRRVQEHNKSQKGAKYTRLRRPVRLVYSERCKDRSSASKREYAIKKLKRVDKLGIIAKNKREDKNDI